MVPSATELHYFLEVANTLNISRASERLGISQPTLSLAIKRIESAIGTRLLIRHKQGVSLTQAGKQLVLHTRQLLQYWEKTKTEALASEQKVQGYFTLGCHSTIAMHLASDFLPNLLEKHPKLEIHLKHDISRKITEEVINLSIDIGIVVNPFKHPDLVILKLCEDEVTFWSSNANRRTQELWSDQTIILCDPDLIQTQTLLKQLKKKGISPQRILTMNSLEVIANLTSKGCGIGIIPTRVAQEMYPESLHRLPDQPVFTDEICLIYRHENRAIQAIQTIVTTIKEFLA